MKMNLKGIAKIILPALVISTLLASTVAAQTAQVISVVGNGTLLVEPDIAYLSVGVRTTAKDVASASEENNKRTESVVAALLKAGIEQKDIKTQNFFVSPIYDFSNGRSETITGYDVNNTLNVTVRKIDEAGKIIDASIAAGANVLNGISFSVETPSKYYGQLFQKAVDSANKKAAAIAAALNTEITPALSVTENGAMVSPAAFANIEMAAGSGMDAARAPQPTFTAPGELELSVGITVVYGFK